MKHSTRIALLARSLVVCGMLSVFDVAYAFDFVSVDTPSILYDAPSLKAKKLFVATRYLPLEQIVILDNWVKVRDSSRQLYWIEKRALSSKRFVTVKLPVATVRAGPDVNSAIVFLAPQQLALEWQGDAGNGWLQIRHIDGTAGYVKNSEVWGG